MFVWLVLGILIGFLLYLSPAVIGMKLPFKLRTKLACFYYDQAMRLFGRLVLCKRKHGEIMQYASTYDEAKSAEKIQFGGKKSSEAFFDDPFGAVHFLYNRPIMLVDERVSTIFDPRLAVIGSEILKAVRAGDHMHSFSDSEGNAFNAYCGYIFIPHKLEIVDMSGALSIFVGSAEPLLASTIRKYVELSQRQFKTVPLTELGLGLLFFGVGYGLSALTVFYLDKNPVPPIDVNLPLSILLNFL